MTDLMARMKTLVMSKSTLQKLWWFLEKIQVQNFIIIIILWSLLFKILSLSESYV